MSKIFAQGPDTAARSAREKPPQMHNVSQERAAAPPLGPAGRRIWRWLVRECGRDQLRAAEPLARKLALTADRLAEVRETLAAGAESCAIGSS